MCLTEPHTYVILRAVSHDENSIGYLGVLLQKRVII